MERLEKAKSVGLEQEMEKIVTYLENCLERGFEGGYWGYYISKPLGELLNKNGISFSTYISEDFVESKVWYRKGDISSEFKRD